MTAKFYLQGCNYSTYRAITGVVFKNLLISLCFFCFFDGISQNQRSLLYSHSFRTSKSINFDFFNKDSSSISNKMLLELAKSAQKNVKYLKCNLGYSINYKIFGTTFNKTLLNIYIDSVFINGDIYYKGFDASNFLLPYGFSAFIHIENKLPYINVELLPIKIDISNKNKNIFELVIADTILITEPRVDFLSQSFVYNEKNELLFFKFIDLVNKYYDSDVILDNILQELNSVNLENIDLLPLQDFTMDFVEKEIKKVEDNKFDSNLPLASFDPIKFKFRFDSLVIASKQKRVVLDQLLSNIDYVYYKKGISLFEAKDTLQAIKYFEKSVNANSNYIPSHFQLSLIEFYQHNFEFSIQRLNNILLLMNPDKAYRDLGIQQLNNVYQYLLQHAKIQIANENFNEAIDKLTLTKNFCSNSKYIACTDELARLLAQSKYGIYNSYLTVAKQAMGMDNLKISENLLRQAKNYQSQNQSEILTSGDADKLLIELADKYIEKASLQNTLQNFEKALEMLLKANDICQILQSYSCPEKLTNELKNSRAGLYSEMIKKAVFYLKENKLNDAEFELANAEMFFGNHQDELVKSARFDSVLNSIKNIRYLSLIDSGKKELIYGFARNALPLLEFAKDLERKYKFVRVNYLDSLIMVASKPVLIEKSQHGALKAWANDLDSANLILNSVICLQKKYQLENDCQINESISDLIQRIDQQYCINQTYNYRNILDEAFVLISHKEFFMLEKKIQCGVDLVNESKPCLISLNEILDLKEKFKNVFEYLKVLETFDSIVMEGDFIKFINAYNFSETFYNDNKLDVYETPRFKLYQYFNRSNDWNFLAFGVHYFCEEKRFNDSFTLLKKLKDQKYPINFSKGLQEELGKALAMRDKKQNPAANPISNILPIIKDDKYFVFFKRQYLKTWKSSK